MCALRYGIFLHVRALEPDIEPVTTNPCVPSPCGPNSICQNHNSIPTCSCHQNYIGRPPNCRPECTTNSECEGHLACQNERCRDPCIGSCGPYAQCVVVHHTPVCTCEPGYGGDPFIQCSRVPERKRNDHLTTKLTPLTVQMLRIEKVNKLTVAIKILTANEMCR